MTLLVGDTDSLRSQTVLCTGRGGQNWSKQWGLVRGTCCQPSKDMWADILPCSAGTALVQHVKSIGQSHTAEALAEATQSLDPTYSLWPAGLTLSEASDLSPPM
jgi:hypothetical protein